MGENISKLLILLCILSSCSSPANDSSESSKHYDVEVNPITQTVKVGRSAMLNCIATNIADIKLFTAMELRKETYSPHAHRICENDRFGHSCDASRASCINCTSSVAHGKMTVVIKNITWEDRGEYYCFVMGNVKSHANIHVLSQPHDIWCNQSERFKGFTVVICSVSCTNMKLKVVENGNIMKKADSWEEKKDCTGIQAGMKKYTYSFFIADIYDGHDVDTSISFEGVDYSKTIKVHDIIDPGSSRAATTKGYGNNIDTTPAISHFPETETLTERCSGSIPESVSIASFIVNIVVMGALISYPFYRRFVVPKAGKEFKTQDSVPYEKVKDNEENELNSVCIQNQDGQSIPTGANASQENVTREASTPVDIHRVGATSETSDVPGDATHSSEDVRVEEASDDDILNVDDAEHMSPQAAIGALEKGNEQHENKRITPDDSHKKDENSFLLMPEDSRVSITVDSVDARYSIDVLSIGDDDVFD